MQVGIFAFAAVVCNSSNGYKSSLFFAMNALPPVVSTSRLWSSIKKLSAAPSVVKTIPLPPGASTALKKLAGGLVTLEDEFV